MVDEDIAIEGVTDKAKLLTLTGSEGLEVGITDLLAENRNEALALLEFGDLPVQQVEINWAERVARFVTDPVVSSLLMSLGFIGLLMELYSPGFGAGGLIGISCLLLFFGGQYLGHLAGWEELLIFVIGLVLLAVELYLIPGFGVTGIAGITAILVALVMALVQVNLPWEVARDLGYLREALSQAVIQLAVVFVIVGVAGAVMAKTLPKSRFGSWLVFKPSPAAPDSSAGLGAEAHGGSLPTRSDLMGKQGTTRSVLRPSGIVEFELERVHVVTEGEFIDVDETVTVVAVEGHRIVVKLA
jgi:membrane-bound serine protease (ClpP class)